MALDRLWISEDPDTKFGAFPATDITPYLKAISDAIGQLSAVSRIPPTYFVQTDLANPPSAASLEASETGLINKIGERQVGYGDSWESVARLVMKVAEVEAPEDSLATLNALGKIPGPAPIPQTIDTASRCKRWDAVGDDSWSSSASRLRSCSDGGQHAPDLSRKLMPGAMSWDRRPPDLSSPWIPPLLRPAGRPLA